MQNAFERELVDLVFKSDVDAITENIRCMRGYAFGRHLKKLRAYVTETQQCMCMNFLSELSFRNIHFFCTFSWIWTLRSSWKLNIVCCYVQILFIFTTLLNFMYIRDIHECKPLNLINEFINFFIRSKNISKTTSSDWGLLSRTFFASLTLFL